MSQGTTRAISPANQEPAADWRLWCVSGSLTALLFGDTEVMNAGAEARKGQLVREGSAPEGYRTKRADAPPLFPQLDAAFWLSQVVDNQL